MRSKKLLATLAVVTMLGSLTACDNASKDMGSSQPSGAAGFDVSTVTKSDSLVADVPAAIKAKGVLTFGSDTTSAPAESLGGSDGQTPIGYEIDLAKAIAAKLGLTAKVESAQFGSILPAVGTKYDLGLAQFTITPERQKAVTFVSYFVAGRQWAVLKGNPKNFDPANYCGNSVGVQTGTTVETVMNDDSAKCVADGKPAIKVVPLKNQTDVTTRVINGGIDAMFADSPTTGYAISQTEGKLETVGEVTDSAPEGIAVAKDDAAFATLISGAVNELIADGSYQKILETWGVDDGAIKKSEVNPTATK